MNPESIVPVMLCFDIEPDARALRGRTPEPLAGFEHLAKMVPELRDRLSEASGAPARFTWCVRIDPQITEVYGSPVALVDRYERELDGVRDAGDAFGVHPHTWRWQGRWVSERADAAWVAHCLAVGLEGYRDAFGVPCQIHKAGDEFITTALARQLDDAGITCDLTVAPGLAAVRGLMPADIEEATGWVQDTQTVPHFAYRPRRDDFRRPDPDRNDGLAILPLTSGLTFAMDRSGSPSRPTGTFETLSPWIDPARFAAMLELRLASPTLTHLAFAVRSDTALYPDLWETVETNLAGLADRLAERHRWYTATETTTAALGHQPDLVTEAPERAAERAQRWARGYQDPGFRDHVDLDALDLDEDDPLLAPALVRSPLRVSAVLPVFDGSRYVRGAVESLANQTEPPDELVVVNDGSAASDLEFLDALAVPFSIRVVHQPNAGQSAARNAGVRIATGELVAFLDQDDRWLPEHLAMLCRPLRDDPEVVWSYSDFDEIDTDGQVVTRRYLDQHHVEHPKQTLRACIERDLMVLPSASVLRRAAFEQLGGFDATLRGYEDDDLYVRAFRAGARFAFTPEALTLYRVHSAGDSATSRFTESRLRFSAKLRDSIVDDRRLGRYYFSDHIVPRFFDASLHDYLRAVSFEDWDAAGRLYQNLVTFNRLRRRRVPRWKLRMLRHPRRFRRLLAAHERLPRPLRITKNPIVHLR